MIVIIGLILLYADTGIEYDATEVPSEEYGGTNTILPFAPAWPDAADPGAHWFPAHRGWIVETESDRELARLGAAAAEKWIILEWSQEPASHIPVLAGADNVFILNDAHRQFFLPLALICKACVQFRRLSTLPQAERNQLYARIRLSAPESSASDYHAVLYYRKAQVWDERTLPVRIAELAMRVVQAAHGDYATFRENIRPLFLSPFELDYKVLIGFIDVGLNECLPRQVVLPPAWVLIRYSEMVDGTLVGPTQAWLDAALRQLGGMSWDEYFMTYGFLPGDRSICDMQYGPLRRQFHIGPWAATRELRLTDYVVPYFETSAELERYAEDELLKELATNWLATQHGLDEFLGLPARQWEWSLENDTALGEMLDTIEE